MSALLLWKIAEIYRKRMDMEHRDEKLQEKPAGHKAGNQQDTQVGNEKEKRKTQA